MTGRPSSQELADEALAFCREIDRLEHENLGWGYQWEHLGDASKDIHVLMRHVRALAARLQTTEQALGEIMSRCETRRTGVLMDGRSTWAVPLAGEVHEIARRALEGAAE